MVVNQGKTEMLYSTRDKRKQELSIKVGDTIVTSKKTIKALGVMISADLNWSTHLNYAINKSKHIISRFKFLKKYLNMEDLLRLVTTQFLSIIYYASPVWIGSMLSRDWKCLNLTHYAAMRVVIGDYK
jgi:hypothetical protein